MTNIHEIQRTYDPTTGRRPYRTVLRSGLPVASYEVENLEAMIRADNRELDTPKESNR